ncbi:MAG: ComEC family competence protein, partial [Chloroflexi bacterium]
MRVAPLIGIALLVGIVAGGVRWSIAAPATRPGGVEALPTETPIRLTGLVADEPTPRGTAHDLILEDLELRDPSLGDDPIPGRLLVRLPRAFAVEARDEVALEVTLRSPDPFDSEEAAYRERLRRQGIGALASAWELRVIGHRSNPLLEAPAGARRWLLDGLVQTVPEPEASLGAGILLGVRAGIDPAIRDAFAVAGLSHVVAISGWNVAIVVALIAAATNRLRARFGPRIPTVVAVIAVTAYVALVGASPAVVRAALMAAALLFARLGGSPAHAASALMGAVLVMVLVSPGALWDVGFQLSALATAGLLVLASPLEARLGRWPPWIRTPVALTVAAQAATLPVLLATFEQVSLVAPLANDVVVPLIPAVMAGAAAAAVIGGLAAAIPLPLAADGGS